MKWDALALQLGMLEFGFARFCEKTADRANREGFAKLHQQLVLQSREEESHAKMFMSIANQGQIRRLERSKNLAWGWDTRTNSPVCFEGISGRYSLVNFFLNGKTADSFDLPNSLAFMCIGESALHFFYTLLALFAPNPLDAILEKISQDEGNHHYFLLQNLFSTSGWKRGLTLLIKWEIQKHKTILQFLCHLLLKNLKINFQKFTNIQVPLFMGACSMGISRIKSLQQTLVTILLQCLKATIL